MRYRRHVGTEVEVNNPQSRRLESAYEESITPRIRHCPRLLFTAAVLLAAW